MDLTIERRVTAIPGEIGTAVPKHLVLVAEKFCSGPLRFAEVRVIQELPELLDVTHFAANFSIRHVETPVTWNWVPERSELLPSLVNSECE